MRSPAVTVWLLVITTSSVGASWLMSVATVTDGAEPSPTTILAASKVCWVPTGTSPNTRLGATASSTVGVVPV